MQDKEKQLIENLFDRLKKTELNSSLRDEEADDLIKNFVKNQPSSSYYMIQTILIQETAIQKMNSNIEELKNKILQLESNNAVKKPSFLSGFFSKQKPASSVIPQNNNNTWKNESSSVENNMNKPIPSYHQNHSGSSFLSNALQTATGVAGGMIVGNLLMNLFQNNKPEEDIFHNHIHHSISDNIDKNDSNNTIHDDNVHDDNIYDGDLINYEDEKDNFYEANDAFDEDSNINSMNDEYIDDIDMNDDNLM